MRAAVIEDAKLRVEVRPDPEPGAGELVVRVRGAGLNGADMLQRKGQYPVPPGWPEDIPGMELAGEIVAVGPGPTGFAEGDRGVAVSGGRGEARLGDGH